MKTMEPPVREQVIGPARRDGGRGWWMMFVAAVAAFSVGVAGGWALFSGDGAEPDAVVVGGDDLTARQHDMIDMVKDFNDAWARADGEAVEAMFADPNGAFRVGPGGTLFESAFVLSAGDEGAIAGTLRSGMLSVTPATEGGTVGTPMLVESNRVLSYVENQGTWVQVFEFTPTGDLEIVDFLLTW